MYESVHTREEVGEFLSAVDLISLLVTVPSSSHATRNYNYRLLVAHLFTVFLLSLLLFHLIGPNEPVQNIPGPHWSGSNSRDRKG